jgi:site-specific DNA recombinase
MLPLPASGTWIYRKYYKDKAQCPMMPVSEADVYRAFLHLFNKLPEHQEKIFKLLISD